MKKILIIDGNSILNRAFFGIRAMTTSKDGRFTNAIYGLVNILHRELESLRPDYAAISVGHNSYGHPTAEAIERAIGFGAELYRTDLNGNICFYIGEDNG